MNMKKRYITLILVNLSFWLTMFVFLVYMVLLNGGLTANNLGLVVYAAAFLIIVFLYPVAYGIVSYLCVKNIFFSQLILLGPIFILTFILFPDFSSFSAIEGRLGLMVIYTLLSLIPALITKLIVKLVEYKKSRNITPSPDQPQQ